MKKTNLFKTVLLLCALIVGSGSAWADDTYAKVTSTSDIVTDGTTQYIIGYTDGTTAHVAGAWSTNKFVRLELTASSDEITVPTSSTATIFVLGGSSSDGYTIQISGGKYVSYNTGTKLQQVETASSNADKWTIANNTTYSRFTIVNKGTTSRYLGRNSNNMTAYDNQNMGTMPPLTLYKKVEASALESIAVSGSYPTVFHQGDAFSHEGMTVTATYDNSTTKDVTSNATFSGYNMATTGSQTVTVSYTENNVTKTTTYSISVNAPAALESITLSGTYTTTFNQGDTFEHDGLIVTAHYDDETSKNVTEDAEFSGYNMSTAGNQTVTVSYTESEVTKTATYDITVNTYVQPTEVSMSLNNAFFGTSYTGANAKGSGEHSGSTSNVTVNFKSGGDKNNFYISDSEIRAYSGNTLEFVAPTNYVITKIVFTNAWATGTTVSEGELNNARKEWNNDEGSESVGFTPTSRSDITSLTVYLMEVEAVTISTAEYATYCNSSKILDFKTAGIQAFIAKDNGTTISLTEIINGEVPAGTPVILYKEGADGTAINVPVIASTTTVVEDGTNDLRVSNGTDVENMYVLAMNPTIGFYKWTGSSLPAGKIYLQGVNNAREFIGFDGETTGIESVKAACTMKGEYFNLAGQRVAQPTKGLYIVNGKKVVIK